MQKIAFNCIYFDNRAGQGKGNYMGTCGVEIFFKKEGKSGCWDEIYTRKREEVIKAEKFKALE